MPNDSNLILLTGATGYVGGRLLYALETAGYRVRCITRHPKALNQRVAKKTEILKGDVLEAPSLPVGMVGVHTAYSLCIRWLRRILSKRKTRKEQVLSQPRPSTRE